MKKLYSLAMAVAISVFASAQTLNVHFKNGTTVNFPKSVVDHIDFSEKAPDPTLTAGDAVDMGLSVMWASCNVGATAPEEYGGYYAWGETSTKANYTGDNYAYNDKENSVYINIGDNIAGTAYDAATVNIGNGWKMPTKEQMQELVDKCTWENKTINGTFGYLITAKNGNTIFLPAAGALLDGISYRVGERFMYATSNIYDNSRIYYLNDKSVTIWGRYPGYSIRPVISYDDYLGIDHSGDKEVTSKVSVAYVGGSIMSVGGTIKGGSQLNFRFTNGSNKDVTLTGIYLVNGENGSAGNNGLSEDVTIAAGQSVTYTITVGALGIQSPIGRFTYTYNYKSYTLEAQYK